MVDENSFRKKPVKIARDVPLDDKTCDESP
jgi:hypothetical protein